MASHANKHIREAIEYAEERGWKFIKAAAGPTFMERSGVAAVTVMDAGSACIRRRAFRKIMLGGFDVPWIVVRTEGTTS